MDSFIYVWVFGYYYYFDYQRVVFLADYVYYLSVVDFYDVFIVNLQEDSMVLEGGFRGEVVGGQFTVEMRLFFRGVNVGILGDRFGSELKVFLGKQERKSGGWLCRLFNVVRALGSGFFVVGVFYLARGTWQNFIE